MFSHIIGVGGIGSGMFFSLSGNHTLGRNESRMGILNPSKDFCKLHVIMHYVSKLLINADKNFQSFPIGKVGNDKTGIQLVEQMKSVGMDIRGIQICENEHTLFSVCFQYPDNTGGNITTENSASNEVNKKDLSDFFDEFPLDSKKEIILSVPEVPFDTRIALLKYGRQRGSYNVASITPGDAEEFKKENGFAMVDLLAINIDEAAAIANIETNTDSQKKVEKCINTIKAQNSDIVVLITEGSAGSYCYQNNNLEHTSAFHVPVSSTAGAGDAFLSGALIGHCLGLNFIKGSNDTNLGSTPLKTAVELGTLLSAISVTSPDTIHLSVNGQKLYDFAIENNLNFSDEFLNVFRILQKI